MPPLLAAAIVAAFTLIGIWAGRRHGRREGRRRALATDDALVQDLAVAKYAVQAGRLDDGLRALDDALDAAKRTATAQLGELSDPAGVRPGDLVREKGGGGRC